jgi:hypothetical protein
MYFSRLASRTACRSGLAAIGVALVGWIEWTGGNTGPGQLVARGLVLVVVDLDLE